MKQHPILFNGPMVRASLNGSKTQTRRIVKIKPPMSNPPYFATGNVLSDLPRQPGAFMEFRYDKQMPDSASFLIKCPFGQVGDQLWVRETWMPDAPRDGTWADIEFYGCKHAPLSYIPKHYQNPEHCLFRASWTGTQLCGWTPSIHMPRWASRITLEITSIRVERLLDISEEDAKAEGTTSSGVGFDLDHLKYRAGFQTLWESINGAGSWDANPWVWVIEFKRVEQ